MQSHFLWCLLAFYSISFVRCGNVSTEVSEQRDNEMVDEAVAKWEEFNECSGPYFARTQENIAASGHANFYREWHHRIIEDPKQRGRLSKSSSYYLFANDHWESIDFECGIDNSGGCTNPPVCEKIVRQVKTHNPQNTTEEVLDLSRKVYFTMKAMLSINQELAATYSSMTTIQTNVGQSVELLVRHFSQQVDRKSDIICAILGHTLEALFDSSQVVIASKAGKKICKERCIITNLMSLGYGVIGDMKDLILEIKEESLGRPDESGYEMHLTPKYVDDFCSVFGGGRQDMNADYSIKIRENVYKLFGDYRRILSRVSQVLNTGHSLDDWIDRGDWSHDSLVLNGRKDDYERKMTKAFKQWIISSIWAGSQCFMKCKVGPHQESACKGGEGNQARYCPTDSELCQAECWTTIKEGNHELELYGLQYLKDHDLSMQMVMESSYTNFKQDHNKRTHPSINQNMTFGEAPLISLPTCISEHANIWNFTSFDDPFNLMDMNVNFPCTCGDWRSNETSDFMRRLGFAWVEPNPRTTWASELFRKTCPKVLEKFPPATRFLALCGLGIRWPNHDDGRPRPLENGEAKVLPHHENSFVMGSRDPRCDSVLKQTEGMTEDQGNRFFCSAMAERKAIFAEESGWVHDIAPFPKSHQRLCKKWLRENKQQDFTSQEWKQKHNQEFNGRASNYGTFN